MPVLKMRVSKDTKSAFMVWLGQLQKTSDKDHVSYEEGLQELLREKGLMPPKAQVY